MPDGGIFIASDTQTLSDLFDGAAVSKRFDPGATIACEGEPQHWVYRVARGCVRSCIYSSEGHRKILRFHKPGEILGASASDDWKTTEEAVDTVVLEALSVSAFETALARSDRAQRELRDCLAEEIEAHARLLVLTANSSAIERVRSFLRSYADGRESAGFVALPMCRRDIADHLGLSMESVCRSISALKRSGVIDLRGASFFRFRASSPAKVMPAA